MCCSLCVVCCVLFAVCYLLCVVCCVLFVVLLFAVCCVLFGVVCWCELLNNGVCWLVLFVAHRLLVVVVCGVLLCVA